MTLTLLIDLDDTLLENSTAAFIPAYLKALCSYLSDDTHDAEEILAVLMSSTQQMMHNSDPGKTLKEVFDPLFYPALGWEYQQVHPKIEEFYRTRYPELRKNTSPNPAARPLVEKYLKENDLLAVATNPIFPRDAVNQRLDWAGLGDYLNQFSLVTSYEQMHFAKPNPAYYAEVLAKLGWQDGPAVMVGDDLAADIEPALTLGLPAYWVDGDNDYAQHGEIPFGAGGLAQFPAWLEQQSVESLTPSYSTPAASLAILQSTPAALDTLLKHLPQPIWHFSPGGREWDLTQIVCHLRDVDRGIFIPRLEEVIQSEKPFLEAVNADSWAEERGYQDQDGLQAFRDFLASRNELVALLNQIPEDAWGKELRHTIFGPISYPELLSISAKHDQLHLQQIMTNIASAGDPAN